MKKIDLHIHTIPTVSDSHFDFSIEKLQEYVNKLEIDCIAITNHNVFDLKQYYEISKELSIPVYPGVEIDLENGHLLLITDIDDAADLSTKCTYLSKYFTNKDDFITLEIFNELFPSTDRYILIPHYHKKPSLDKEIIKTFGTSINAGEVSSVKKFLSCLKEAESLVPVIFSDSRFSKTLKTLPTKQTFIDLDEISFSGIKYCLTDKQKVFLTKEDGNNFFQATDEGLKLSTGLNVILGGRSTGKTYTLNKIASSFDNVKYIEQFSLLQNDEEKFEELLSRRHSSVSENYLEKFKLVVDDVKNIDLKQDDIEFGRYLSSLLKFASESEKEDAYSNTKLFSETPFATKDLSSLRNLINATKLLKENTEYKNIINKHIDSDSLLLLEIDLMKEFIKEQEKNKKKEWLNNIIASVSSELRFRTSATPPEDVDFYKILIDRKKVKKFNKIASGIESEKIIDSKEIRDFKIIAKSSPFQNASQLQKICKRKPRFSSAFPNYNNPYKYLCSLKELDLEETELYKYFVKIDYQTLNKHGFKVSGGERSEFNLLHEINDALKYDMLLIDEPESSFDNLFLKNEVNILLRDIAKEIPVVVVTHNNTVGASIKPNYIACTQRIIGATDIEYKIYSGNPADKRLKNSKGEEINNYQVMLDCLEAGNEEYNKRRTETYEILKD